MYASFKGMGGARGLQEDWDLGGLLRHITRDVVYALYDGP